MRVSELCAVLCHFENDPEVQVSVNGLVVSIDSIRVKFNDGTIVIEGATYVHTDR
jgi:hypothetical protein